MSEPTLEVRYAQTALPVLLECDLVVQDGSFLGISAALASAEQGKRVVLIESRTFLGWEMTACLRPWLSFKEIENQPDLPSVIQVLLNPVCCKTIGDEVVFQMDQVKLALENCLLDAGVQILYASRAIDLLIWDDELQGIVIGNKSCRQAIRCHEYQDYSRSGLWAGGQDLFSKPVVWRTLEFTDLDLSRVTNLTLPEFFGAGLEKFRIHRGFHNDRHWLVEFPLCLDLFQSADGGLTQNAECQAQELAFKVAQHLINQVDAFQGAYWAGASYESYPWSGSLLDHLARFPSSSLCHPTSEQVQNHQGDAVTVHELDIFAHTAAAFIDAPSQVVKIAERVDVLVVGSGSSGTAAAVTSAENGMKTLLVEMNPRLGGTGTLGGVQSYWYGREAGFNLRLCKEVLIAHQQLRHPIPSGSIPKWNIEAKAYALLKFARNKGVQVAFHCRAIGTIMDGQVVRGVVFSTPDGLSAVEARVVIDATGDGDIAAFAGAQFAYGSARNRSTMWYSLAQFSAPGKTTNNFTSMVDIGNVVDYTRAILSGRRRGKDCAEHGIYLAARESRQVLGEAQITLTDQLRQHCYQDVIHIAFSNYDVKGHTDSDWLRVGLIPPNLEIEIPLGAVIPQGIEHLLVVGKAISATHDALPSIRMQRDMENLGGAAGIIAAVSLKHDCPLRKIPIREVQNLLVQADLLPPDILTRSCEPVPVDVASQLSLLKADQPLYAYSDMDMEVVYRGAIPFVELCCAGENALPQIRMALQRASGPLGILLAQALAMMGDASGIEDLLDALHQQLAAGHLPLRNAKIRNTQLPPDQGAMPDVVYWLYSLGMLRDERAVPIWEQAASYLLQTNVEDFYSQVKGTFYYIDAICYGAERLGSSQCARVLRSLQQIPYLQNRTTNSLIQPDFVLERLAFLELAVARAMLRCGMPEGLPVLINYLDDTRVNLRGHAHSLLVMFTGIDLKMDKVAWEHWQRDADFNPLCLPDTSQTDAQKAW